MARSDQQVKEGVTNPKAAWDIGSLRQNIYHLFRLYKFLFTLYHSLMLTANAKTILLSVTFAFRLSGKIFGHGTAPVQGVKSAFDQPHPSSTAIEMLGSTNSTLALT